MARETREFEEQRVPPWVKTALSVGAAVLFVVGFALGAFFGRVGLGVLLFAIGAILFAFRGYLNTGDKVVAGALIFVAIAAIGIQAIVFFLGP